MARARHVLRRQPNYVGTALERAVKRPPVAAKRRPSAGKERASTPSSPATNRKSGTQGPHHRRHYAHGVPRTRTRTADIYEVGAPGYNYNWIPRHRAKHHAVKKAELILPLARIKIMMQGSLSNLNRQISDSAVLAVAHASEDMLKELMVSAATVADVAGGRVTVKPKDVAVAYLAMMEGAHHLKHNK